MINNKLSVFIVTYNRCNYLKETIISILNQTYEYFDLIILDNHSDDETGVVVKSFDDPRIHYICHNNNIGGIGNIRYAFEHCNTEFCVVFHDDDIMCPTLLEKEIDVLERNKDIDFVSTNAYLIDSNGNDLGRKMLPTKDDCQDHIFFERDLIVHYLESSRYLVFPTLMYRMDIIRNHNIHPHEEAGPGCDVLFYNEILHWGGRACELQDCLIKYRIHPEQDTQQSLLHIDLDMFDYMRRDLYFSDVLISQKRLIPGVYKRNAKHSIVMMIKGKITYNEAKCYMDKYAECWEHSLATERLMKFLLWTLHIFPKRLSLKFYEATHRSTMG